MSNTRRNEQRIEHQRGSDAGPRRRRGGPAIAGEAPPRRLVAMSLAHEMAEALGAEGEDRDDLASAALAIGGWLADQRRPGRWDTIDVRALLDALALEDPRERGRFLLSLSGLLGYAGLNGHLAPSRARDGLAEIATLAEDPIVRRFARDTARQLEQSLD